MSRATLFWLRKLDYNVVMRRFLYVAAFSFTLCALPSVAQRHGGGGSMHAASGGGFAGHPAGFSHSSGFSHASGVSHGGNFSHSPVRASGVRISGNRTFRHRGFNGRRYVYPYAGYYPYLGYYGGYYPFDDQAYDQSYNQGDDQTADSYADSGYQVPYRENNDVSREVQTLNGKIDRLQADLDARSHPSSNTEPATALVFRDQHVEEIRNYAISGGTLWVFGDQSAKKIPLAQLDLAATAKMNDERGVDFQVPR